MNMKEEQAFLTKDYCNLLTVRETKHPISSARVLKGNAKNFSMI